MQRYHRNRHRLLWLILGPLAVAAFIYALVNRIEMPVMETLPVPGEERREDSSKKR